MHRRARFQNGRDKSLLAHTPYCFLSSLVSHTVATAPYRLGKWPWGDAQLRLAQWDAAVWFLEATRVVERESHRWRACRRLSLAGPLAPLQLEASAHTAEESSDELVQKLLRGEVQVQFAFFLYPSLLLLPKVRMNAQIPVIVR